MTKETAMSSQMSKTLKPRSHYGRVAALAVSILTAVAIAALCAGSAEAEVSIRSFEAYPSTTQAGGHPDFTIAFETDTREEPKLPTACGCNAAKNIIVNTPAGVVGNPHAAPRCNAQQYAFDECPMDSQIGVVTPTGCIGQGLCARYPVPLYNLVPPPQQAGLLGFKTLTVNTPIFTVLTARTGGDYGLRASVVGLQNLVTVPQFIQQIWGVPADPANDDFRFRKTPVLTERDTGYPSNSPLTPFMTNPTTCGDESMVTTIEIQAYDLGRTFAEAAWPATTGCGLLSFNPSLSAKPTTTEADTSSGVDVDLTVPQPQTATTPSASEIRAVTIRLPEGFSINPNAADGKTACSDAAAKFGTEDEAECPENAKIGTLEVHSAVLPDTLPGAVYLGAPLSGHQYRLFLVADGFGLHVKLAGEALVDRSTGQITVSFQNLPQTPFEEFNMHLFGSERGVLATPDKCGTYSVVSTFTPWDDELAEQGSTQFFVIDSGPGGAPCPGVTRPFAPTFKAASVGNTAGAYSPFQVSLSRPDGDQNLAALSVVTPPGFSGKLAGIPYCPDAALSTFGNSLYTGQSEIATPVCPAASQIGTAIAGAGAGTHPIYTSGKVYLAGPYKGAPLSLVVVIPAVSGPYDVGNVAVRSAINVDPVTAQVTTVTDALPQILGGIPLRTRLIQVKLDRPEFALNPTNCNPLSVDALLVGSEGGQAARSSHYQVANCATLSFQPRLGLKLTGGLERRGHPAIHAVFQSKPGESNTHFVSVLMPKGELLDNAHIGAVCTRVNFRAGNCPPSSLLGTAEAKTPLLDEPLKGFAYLRSSSHELPDIAVALQGQVSFELVGRVDSVNARLRTTFESVPDVPVTKFSLDLFGGKRGLLVNSESLCGKPTFAVVKTIGQNGVGADSKSKLQVGCGSKPRHKRHHLKHARAVR